MSNLSEIPRETLKRLFARDGDALLEDPNRCEALLKDYCGAHRREISALVGALEERVATELRSSWQTAMTPEAMRARLVQRMVDHRGLAKEVAEYGVDSWSEVLGVGLHRVSDRLPTQVINVSAAVPPPPPPPPPPAAAQYSPQGVPYAMPYMQQPQMAAAVPVQPPQPSGGSKSSIAIGAVAALVLAAGGFFALPKLLEKDKKQEPPCANRGADGVCHDKDPAPEPPPPPPPPPTVAKVVPAGAAFDVRIGAELSSATATVGQTVSGTLTQPVRNADGEVLPAGAKVALQVKEVDNAGRLAGVPVVKVAMVQVEANGKPFVTLAAPYTAKGPSRTENTEKKKGIGTALGCAGGAVVGVFHGKVKKDCGKGATGGGAGGVVVAATDKIQPALIANGAVLRFSLLQPLTVE